MSAGSLSGGSIRILWDASDSATVTITGGTAAWTVNGSAITFPYTLSSSTTFDTIHGGTYTVSVQHHGYEVANTPDGTRTCELGFGQQVIFAPTPDGTPNSKFLGDLHDSLSAGNIDATVRKLNDDFADVNILVLGDSTASQTGQFPDLLMPAVQALYPHRTLQKATWDNTGHTWGSFSQVGSPGTGSYLVKFWQGAVTGTVPESVLNYWDAWVAAVQPDLVIVHYGHNYGKNAADGGQPNDATMDWVFTERYLRLVSEIKRSCPTADVLLVSQNPYLTSGARTQVSNVRAHAVRQIAADLGCAYGPVLEAYLATGSPASYLQGDLLHPNTSGAFNGAQLAADALQPLFRYKANHEVSARSLSPLVVPANNLLLNGDFAAFAAPPTLTNWTASNTTLAKDTTNYESANAYSVKGTGTATANCIMFQSLPIRRVRGQVVTFAARFYIAAAQASSQIGRVQISGDGGLVTTTSGTLTNVRDNWVWAFVTVRVPAAATFATASIIFGGASGHECSVDRAIATVGHMPRGLV